MTAKDDWGRVFDQKVEYREKVKPQPTPEEETSAGPGAADERPVEPQRAQGRVHIQGRRKERFEAGENSERGSRKRSKRRSRDEVDVGEDGDAADEFESYHERQRRKAERKAQREAERIGPIPIIIPELISITALANALKIQPDTFLYQLGELGFEGVTLDSLMAGETAALVAQEYGYEPTVDAGQDRNLKPRPPPKDPSVLPQRPPVVTIMGHVDHGKTTLLDYLRKSSVAAQEHGGITQHIGAFSVKLSSGNPITFLDTPGHAAFLTMRQRGANVTDIVVLVVAADDSVKPQTLEALKHARDAKVPIIVAINKIDKDGAQVDMVKADLARYGVEIEDFGGEVQTVCVSGKTGQGMDQLEEAILTLSEILDHRAEVDGPAEGWILESSLKPIGKVATILVKRGTLRPGDYIVAGLTWAKIRSLRNEAGVIIKEAPPGTPVEIMGWKDLPAAGNSVIQAPNEGRAKSAVTYRESIHERERDAAAYEIIAEERKALQEKRAREKSDHEKSDHEKSDSEATKDAGLPEKENGITMVNFAVKGDVHGSVEAVCAAILEIGNNEVRPRVLRSATGPISESDIEHAATSSSVLVNFATPIPGHVRHLAEKQGVQILDHNIIYHLVDNVTAILSKHLTPIASSEVLGEAEILEIFPINVERRVMKNIAGCRVRTGVVERNALYRILRNGKTIFEDKLETLKHLKDEVAEVGKGMECGICLEKFEDFEVGDVLQAYKEVMIERSL
ncbi:mitochondrial translation initiation factor 2 [Biscogniauxia marginata]|nr:mitochondrial translation initiation factor 2 [Biscogniauxia marginata]